MSKLKFYLALFFLVVVVFFFDGPILKYSIALWQEPKLVLVHVALTLMLFVFLQSRVSLWVAFVGALLFGLFPGHTFFLAMGQQNVWTVLIYVAVLVGSAWCAFGFDQFYKFLRTQEQLVRILFIAGVMALISGMALMDVEANKVWKDEFSLRQYRVVHNPGTIAFNAWANLLYQKAGKPQEAVEFYRQSLRLDPQNIQALFALGEIYEDMGKPEEVIGVYNQLLKFYPEDESVLTRIMAAYSQALHKHPSQTIYQEKREDVLAACEQLSKRKKYSANDFFNLGLLYEQVGGFDEAMRFYRKALALTPSHEKALYNLANRYQESGDFKTALVLYERLLHFHPKFTLAYLNMGVIYNGLGDSSKARYLYQKAITIDPNNADAYFNLGYLNEAAGELREALNNYEKAVENNPHHAEAYYNMGNVYATLGQSPEAIASYLKTISINPNHQNAYVNLSILAFKSRDFEGAIHYLEQARQLGYNAPAEYLKTLQPYRSKK